MVAAVLAIADPDLAEGAREVAGQTLARVTGTVKRPGSSD